MKKQLGINCISSVVEVLAKMGSFERKKLRKTVFWLKTELSLLKSADLGYSSLTRITPYTNL